MENRILANGAETILEDYPVFVGLPQLPELFAFPISIVITIRDRHQQKDEKLWQEYIKSMAFNGKRRNAPDVLISIPDPNKTRVFDFSLIPPS